MKKERMSNIELLRIVSMCGIIAIHYMSEHLGGMSAGAVFPKFSWFFYQIINSISCSLVNCFVLISGYFLIEKTSFSLRKAVDLVVITAYYGVMGYIVGVFSGVTPFTIKGLFYSFFPFFLGNRWFVETYIILILLVPFINKVLRNLENSSYKILLIIQLSIFSVWYSIGASSPILDDGYGIINFITLYMLGAYYKLFKDECLLLRVSKYRLLSGYIACTVITFILSIFIYPFGYAFTTNILAALFIFIFFLKWDLGYNSIINSMSTAAFDVYYVHSDMYTSRLLIYDLLKGNLFVDSIYMIPHLTFVIIVLYLLGMISHRLRNYLFSISINKWLDKIKLINTIKIV